MTAELTHVYSGKVRDIYDVGDGLLLMVASDRISAFDVVMDEPVPDKGRVLTAMSAFWFEKFDGVVGNHLLSTKLDGLPAEAQKPEWEGRVMLCRRAEMLPIECIVRGYITGSAWKEYRTEGTMHGERMAEGLLESSQLPEPVFTPSTKAEDGEHDVNISFEVAASLVGIDIARKAREVSLELYSRGAEWAADARHHHRRHQVRARLHRRRARRGRRGADPGLVAVLAGRAVGARIDAAVVRQAAGARLPRHARLGQEAATPPLPAEVVDASRARYVEAYERVTGRSFADWHG